MKEVKISVVIPCYNCSATIDVCIASVFSQSYLPFEVLLIDDGSKDQTLEMLYAIKEQYANKPVSITVVTQKNQGPSVARNVGLTLAKGEWIAFLDSDDVWHKKKLSKQVEVLTIYPDAVVIGGEKGAFKPEISTAHVAKINFKKLCFKNYFLTSSSMVKREHLQGVLFNITQKHSEDYRFFFDLLSKGDYGVILFENLSCSITMKRDFGDSGLSGDIYKMQRGELSNFKYLYQNKLLNVVEYVFFYLFSNLKFLRRFIISIGYKLTNKQ
ncbi:glycosyltransferase family 2 protein [Myroides sp. C6-3]|uniref:glycosyltransferase family 2 protein n=1 Tax=Myroides sp. C6-3 TaxID=3400535 RepID=UPI003D2F58BB